MHKTCGVCLPCGGGIRRDGIVWWIVSTESTEQTGQVSRNCMGNIEKFIVF